MLHQFVWRIIRDEYANVCVKIVKYTRDGRVHNTRICVLVQKEKKIDRREREKKKKCAGSIINRKCMRQSRVSNRNIYIFTQTLVTSNFNSVNINLNHN